MERNVSAYTRALYFVKLRATKRKYWKTYTNNNWDAEILVLASLKSSQGGNHWTENVNWWQSGECHPENLKDENVNKLQPK